MTSGRIRACGAPSRACWPLFRDLGLFPLETAVWK